MFNPFLGKTKELRPGARAILFYLAVSVAYALLVWLLRSVPGLPTAAYPLGLLAVLLLVSRLALAMEGLPLGALGLRLDGAFAREYARGLLAGTAIIALTALGLYATGGFRLARTPGLGAGTLATGALVYLVPALNEELAFRGYLFQRLEQSLGTWAGLAVMSALFALAHLANPGMAGTTEVLACLNIFLAGWILGLAYLRTRSLALPMGLHLGWNWAQGSLLGFGVSGTEPRGLFTPVLQAKPLWLTGGRFGLEGGLPCTIVCLVVCLILAPWSRAQQTSGKISIITE
jgi:hypothetical protein